MLQCRTEDYSGSKVREAKYVIYFEIFELGNSDILETLKKTILKKSKLRIELDLYIEELISNGYIDDMYEDEKLNFCQKLLDEINSILHTNIKYALWLTSEDVVKNFYKAKTIDYYDISNIILSNLNKDGILYGYENEPIKVYSKEV